MTSLDRYANITHVKGDTFALTFTDVKLDGVDIVWTGWKMNFVVKTSPSSSITILELDETAGINLTVTGQISISASAAVMDLIPARRYVYSLIVEDANGVVCTWLNNKRFEIIAKVE